MPVNTVCSLIIKKENAHDDPIYCCAWTKSNSAGDSKDASKDFIVTGGLDTYVKVWKLENNKLELFHTLVGHEMAVVSVAVSPDGYTIASTSLDSMLIIWDLTSGHKVHEIQTGATDVWKVTFCPEGTMVATGGHTGKVTVYGVEKGIVQRVLDTRGKFALSVDWSPNGKFIASGSVDGIVCVFDVAQAKLLHTIEAHTQPVRSVSFSPNSRLLATASNDGNMMFYDVATAKHLGSVQQSCWSLAAHWAADGSRVACAAADGAVQVALLDGFAPYHTYREHTDMVCGVQFNLNSDKLVSVSKDKCINIYECPVPPKKVAKK